MGTRASMHQRAAESLGLCLYESSAGALIETCGQWWPLGRATYSGTASFALYTRHSGSLHLNQAKKAAPSFHGVIGILLSIVMLFVALGQCQL